MTREAAPGSQLVNVKVLCNPGEVALSGGFTISAGAQATSRVIESSPVDAAEGGRAGWTSTAVLEGVFGKKGRSAALTTFAICAEIPER